MGNAVMYTLLALALLADAILLIGQCGPKWRKRDDAKRPEEFGNLVRVGADHDGVVFPSEVTRIDFDTDEGTVCICVQRLASVGAVVADIFYEDEPAWTRERIGQWKTPNR